MGEAQEAGGIGLIRMYTSADSQTHLEDIILKTTRVLDRGHPGGDMASPELVSELTLFRLDPGYARDWHPTPRRQFVFVVKGEIELTVSDGEGRCFGPGSVVLAEDTTGKGHQTRAVGMGDCVGIWVACP